ncbi:MAG: hypothetical protein ABEH43_08635 [Flavobacteriales bacterium]
MNDKIDLYKDYKCDNKMKQLDDFPDKNVVDGLIIRQLFYYDSEEKKFKTELLKMAPVDHNEKFKGKDPLGYESLYWIDVKKMKN